MNVNYGLTNRDDLSSDRSFIVCRACYDATTGRNRLSTGQRQSRKIGEMEPFVLTFPLAFRETCRAGRINFSRDQIRSTRVETRSSSLSPE